MVLPSAPATAPHTISIGIGGGQSSPRHEQPVGMPSPNSAGIVIDAVRCAKLGLDRGVGGALEGPCSYFMKSPPRQYTDAEARELTLRFIDDGPARGGNGSGRGGLSS